MGTANRREAGRVRWRLAGEVIAITVAFAVPLALLLIIACTVDFGLPTSRPRRCVGDGPGLLVIVPICWLALVVWRYLAAERRLPTDPGRLLARFRRFGFDVRRAASRHALAGLCLLIWLAAVGVRAVAVMSQTWLGLGAVVGAVGVATAIVGRCLRTGVPHVHRFESIDGTTHRCRICGAIETATHVRR
ncbi:MAG: hypothetical protein AAGA93_23815 [Actinomycetota bacterium]